MAALVVAFFVVHYIKFFDALESIGLTVNLGPWCCGLTPDTASYLVLVVAGAFIVARARRPRLKSSRIIDFRDLCVRLLDEGKYGQLVLLLEDYWKDFGRILRRDFHLARLHDKLNPPSKFALQRGGHGVVVKVQSDTLGRKLAQMVSQGVPSYKREQDISKGLVLRVVLAPRLVAELAKLRPYFGLAVVQADLGDRNAFLEFFVTALLDNRESILITSWSIIKA